MKTLPNLEAVQLIPGKKAIGDQVCKINGYPITFVDLAYIIRELVRNENLLYPEKKGGKLLLDYLREAAEYAKYPERVFEIITEYFEKPGP